MPCTKQLYRATQGWTAVQLADLFKAAFIDAGYMTDWFDRFSSSGVENAILRVVYNGAKTYGTAFEWWMFHSSGVYKHVTTGWDAVAHQPTGSQYLDYYSIATNTVADHLQILQTTTSSTIDLYRYTSGADSNQDFFLLLNGTTNRRVFTIANASSQLQPWIDLDKGLFSGYTNFVPNVSARAGLAGFSFGPMIRRSIIRGSALRGQTSNPSYIGSTGSGTDNLQIGYAAVGNATADTSNLPNLGPYIVLPVGHANANTAYSTDSNPIFHSLMFSPYITNNMSSDFGITFHYATNTFSPGDEFESGAQKWDVLDFAANASSVTGASPLFLARMV